MDLFDHNLGNNTLLSFLVLQCNTTSCVAEADTLWLVNVLCTPRSTQVYPSMKNINRQSLSLQGTII
jgi:hypothetical protein